MLVEKALGNLSHEGHLRNDIESVDFGRNWLRIVSSSWLCY